MGVNKIDIDLQHQVIDQRKRQREEGEELQKHQRSELARALWLVRKYKKALNKLRMLGGEAFEIWQTVQGQKNESNVVRIEAIEVVYRYSMYPEHQFLDTAKFVLEMDNKVQAVLKEKREAEERRKKQQQGLKNGKQQTR